MWGYMVQRQQQGLGVRKVRGCDSRREVRELSKNAKEEMGNKYENIRRIGIVTGKQL